MATASISITAARRYQASYTASYVDTYSCATAGRITASDSNNPIVIGLYSNNSVAYMMRLTFKPANNISKVVFSFTSSSGSGSGFRAKISTNSNPDSATSSGASYDTTFSVSSGDGSFTITPSSLLAKNTTYYLYLWRPNDGTYTDFTNITLNYTFTGTIKTYTITYNANGGSAAPSSTTFEHGTSATITSGTPTPPATVTNATYTTILNYNGSGQSNSSQSTSVRTSYAFSKWNTKADGTGTNYSSGGTYSTNADLTLYAVYTSTTTHGSFTLSTPTWATSTDTPYTITYNYNGNGQSDTTAKPVRTATHSFVEWNTSSDGSGTGYSGGTTYTPSATITLYAIWNTVYSVASVTIPSPTRDGYELLGWGTTASSTSNLIAAGSSYTASASITLYAIWKALGLVRIYNPNTGSFDLYQCYIYSGSAWELYAPYISDGTSFELYT